MLVVIFITGTYLQVPIELKTNLVQLALGVLYVLLRPLLWCYATLDGGVLRRKTK